jgi:ribosomal protein S18 acetylase RimI-like enzyme
MTTYQVRPLRENDIESIIAIDAVVTGTGGPDRAGFWRGLLSIHGPGALEEGAPPAPHLCEVAEIAGGGNAPPGRVVGFIIGDVQSWQFGIPRHGRIVTIGVEPAHARKGVATMLAEALLGTFKKMGLPSVQCLARPGDPLGVFFRSVGFEKSDFEVLEVRL